MAYSDDGKSLLTCADLGNPSLRLWDISNPQPRERFGLPGSGVPCLAAALAPRHKAAALACSNGEVRLWDFVPGGPPRPCAPFMGHGDHVFAVAFAPDGKSLASGSADATVRLWDVTAAQPSEGPVLRSHTQRVLGVAFSPTGTLLASASEDRSVRLWDLTASAGSL